MSDLLKCPNCSHEFDEDFGFRLVRQSAAGAHLINFLDAAAAALKVGPIRPTGRYLVRDEDPARPEILMIPPERGTDE